MSESQKLAEGDLVKMLVYRNPLICEYEPSLFEVSSDLPSTQFISHCFELYFFSDLGVHIDGFIATAGHTIVLCTSDVTGRKADVVRAAWAAMEAALRTVVVGGNNEEVTKVMNKCVAEFQCNMVQGVLSHQLKQHVIDGVKCIISKENIEEKV